MFVRDPVAMAQKAAPFLSFDHDPYAVINGGHIDWVVDGYTTTANYPYSQNASTQQVAIGSNLPGSYNYVRNSVKVVIDAYSGQMTFYDVDPSDPILQAYSAAFPHMFTPLSKMTAAAAGAPALPAGHLLHPVRHLRPLPPDQPAGLLRRQQRVAALADRRCRAAVAGAPGPEHLQQPGPARLVDPRPHGSAVPGVLAAGDTHRPTRRSRSRTASSRRRSRRSRAPTRTSTSPRGWSGCRTPGTTASSTCTRSPRARSGPANADAEISADNKVSSDITLLDQHGSEVLLGETLMVPIANSMVYLRPLYASPTTNPQPQLEYVVAVLGRTVKIDTSLSAVLSDVFQTTVTAPTGPACPRPARCRRRWRPLQAGPDRLHQRAGGAEAPGTCRSTRPTSRRWTRQIAQAQQVLSPGATPATTTTTTTTAPPAKGAKSSKTSIDHHDDHDHGADEHRAHGAQLDDHVDDAGLGGRAAGPAEVSRRTIGKKPVAAGRRRVP